MKKILFFIFLTSLLFYFNSCKKMPPDFTPLVLPGTWVQVATGVNANNVFQTGTGFLAYYFTGGSQPVYYSGNAGVTWNATFENSYPLEQYTFANDLMNSSRVVMYSSADSTLYVSTNGGQSWTVLNHPAVKEDVSPAFYLRCASGNRLFAFTWELVDSTFSNALQCFLKSDDMGNTWDTVFRTSADIISSNLTAINGSLYIFTTTQIFHSIDNGATWTVISSFAPSNGYMGQLANGNIYSYDQNNIYVSYDSCRDWSLAASIAYTLEYGIVFDSCILFTSTFPNAGLMCFNPQKGIWYTAYNGLPQNYLNNGGIYFDSQYVYFFYSYGLTSSNTPANISVYRRPRSDFANL